MKNKLLVAFGFVFLVNCGHRDKCLGTGITCIKDFPDDIVGNLLYLSWGGFLNQRTCKLDYTLLSINDKVIRRAQKDREFYRLNTPILPNDQFVITNEARSEYSWGYGLFQCIGFWNFAVEIPNEAVDCRRIPFSQTSKSQLICHFNQGFYSIEISVSTPVIDYSIEVVR